MGTIDESALSNLQLVLQLTKNIHLKSNVNHDEMDLEEYGKHFPSFMWIVRDFTLQMVDEDGDHIEPNQYFENALKEQSGFSQAIEQKNRIRRLIKSFFQDRCCYTLVRPVTDEELLQDLENADESLFRGEFLDGVKSLRNRVSHSVKPKTLNNKPLNPSMYITLAQSYVAAINEGAVPNIENAWHYICQNECKKALEESIAKFNTEFCGEVVHEMPLEETEIRDRYRINKEQCFKFFRDNCVGEVDDVYLYELTSQLDQKYDNLLKHNDTESRKLCFEFLEENYVHIENALTNREITNFYHFDEKMNEFKEYYQQEAPDGPCRSDVLNDFCSGRILQAADLFISDLTRELELNRNMSDENKTRLEKQIKELKSVEKRNQEENEVRYKKLQNEVADLMAKNSSLEERLSESEASFTSKENELKSRLKNDRVKIDKQIEAYKQKDDEMSAKLNETKNQLSSIKLEFEKEVALREDKIKHLNEKCHEYKSSQSNYLSQMDKAKDEVLHSARDRESTLQSKINELESQLDDREDHINELNQRFKEQKQQNAMFIQQIDEIKNSSNNGKLPTGF